MRLVKAAFLHFFLFIVGREGIANYEPIFLACAHFKLSWFGMPVTFHYFVQILDFCDDFFLFDFLRHNSKQSLSLS